MGNFQDMCLNENCGLGQNLLGLCKSEHLNVEEKNGKLGT